MSSSQQITPFKPTIAPEEVDRLYTKLRDARIPQSDVVPGAGGDYGVPTEWANTNYKYWCDTFSWSKAEAKLSQWPHFTTVLEDLSIHFVHQRSTKADAVPLLMVHGWPGSFYEFCEVIDPLTSGEGNQAFHCVVPSLPGFVWSQAPQRRGWTMKDTARIFDALMRRLGYNRYCVQAGDFGQFVARELGAQYAQRCKVVHLNWCPGALPDDVQPTEREATCKAKGDDWRTAHVGYAVLMRTRPQTLGWMLQDNPVGLLGFIGEKVCPYSTTRPLTSQMLMLWIVRRGRQPVCSIVLRMARSYPNDGLPVLLHSLHYDFQPGILRKPASPRICGILRCPREPHQVSIRIY